MHALPNPGDLLRRRLIGEVRAMFNDAGKGEASVQRRPDGLFGPQSAAWRVHGDVTTMMVGGIAALLLQMLHPAVLAGVWDHSNFRTDMAGRLRRTARFIALTTYGSHAEAEGVIAQVRRIHDHVGGVLPDGTPYRAGDPHLLEWVHVTEATSFLDAWLRYGDPHMSGAEQDRYFREFAVVARALGAERVPETRAQARALIADFRPELKVDERTREVAQMVLRQKAPNLAALPFQTLAMQSAVDLLPGWARAMHGLRGAGIGRPLVRGGTLGLAKTLRWAFR